MVRLGEPLDRAQGRPKSEKVERGFDDGGGEPRGRGETQLRRGPSSESDNRAPGMCHHSAEFAQSSPGSHANWLREAMEYSGRWGIRATVAGADLAARLALPASLLALLHGSTRAAIAASLIVTVAGLLRAFVVGRSLQAELVRLWTAIVGAARSRSIASLHHRRDEEEGVSLLTLAVFEAASFSASTLPILVAQGAALVALVVANVVLLDWSWIVVGIVAGLPVGLLVLGGHRRLQRAQERAWSGHSSLSSDMRVLLEATAELRGNGRETAVGGRVLSAADRMARGHREAATYSAMLGLLPAGLAVLGLAAPLEGGAAWLSGLFEVERVADVLLLGAATASAAFSLASSAESAASSAPSRRALRAFLRSGSATARGGTTAVEGSLAEIPIRFDDVSVVHPGSPRATPSRVVHDWRPRSGVAVVGANGGGKSTLAWALLGFVSPSAGRIDVGGRSIQELDLACYRTKVAYVPQAPFVAPGESLFWHFRLFVDAQLEASAMEGALERVNLLPALERLAAREGRSVTDVALAELSGGERQRFFLARALLQDAELLVLDEPEAGMDADGRVLLREALAEAARRCRVFVVVHDRTVIPEDFAVITCRAESCADEPQVALVAGANSAAPTASR